MKNIQLKIRISEDDLEQIQRNAKVCDKTVSAYVRETALNMCVPSPDYKVITDHTAQISACRNAINQLIFTIRKTGSYVPVDIEYILEKTNSMLKSEGEFIDAMIESNDKNRKLIAKKVKTIVNQNIAKGQSKK